MGNCCPSQLQLEKQDPCEQLLYDAESPLMSSYAESSIFTFEKRVYNWHSIPITSALPPLHSRAHFEIRNKGIKDNNFLVGIITRIAIKNLLPKPWKETVCLCYESHETEGHSALLFKGNKVATASRAVRPEEVLRVSFHNAVISFTVGEELLCEREIPPQMKHEELLPYVMLFEAGDKIEFVNPRIGCQRRE